MDTSNEVVNFLRSFGFVVKEKKSIPLHEYQYKFSDGQAIEDLPKLKPEEDYWKYRLQKIRESGDIPEDKIERLVNKRINKIIDYFERLSRNQLKEKERNRPPPKTLIGPYFPTPQDLYFLSSLTIPITWDLSKVHRSRFPQKQCKEIIKYGALTDKEKKRILKRWKKFKKIYDFHDLRPLLHTRTTVITRDEDGEISFYDVHYLNKYQLKDFQYFLSKKLPNRMTCSVYNCVLENIDRFQDSDESLVKDHLMLSCKEFQMTTYFVEKYGVNFYGLDVIIGTRSYKRLSTSLQKLHRLMHIPIKLGPWLMEEDKNFLRTIASMLNIEDLQQFYTKKHCIKWVKVFDQLKNRTPQSCFNHWKELKQQLLFALTVDTGEVEDVYVWLDEDIKLLIESIYNMGVEAKSEIDWFFVSENFTWCSDYEARRMFNYIWKLKLPVEKARNFSEGIQYLYRRSQKGKLSVNRVNCTGIFSKFKYLKDIELRSKNSIINESDLINTSDEDEPLPQAIELHNRDTITTENDIRNTSNEDEPLTLTEMKNKKRSRKRKRSSGDSSHASSPSKKRIK